MKAIVMLGFVLGAALCSEASVYNTRPGMKVKLGCGTQRYKTTLVWIHGDQKIISVNGKTGVPSNGPAVIGKRSRVLANTDLSISDVTKEDAGKFTCNADGASNQHTLLVVTVSASPSVELQLGGSAELHCDVQGLDPDSTVKWTRPDGRPHEGSHLANVAVSDAGAWGCVFSCEGSTFTEKLEIKVKDPAAVTAALPPTGSSEVKPGACHNCVPVPDPQPWAWIGQLSWWVWAAAGAGLLAILLLLVVIVVVLCKMSRRRKKKLRMRKGRKPLQPNQYCQCTCPADAAAAATVAAVATAAKPQRTRRKGRPSTLALKPLLME